MSTGLGPCEHFCSDAAHLFLRNVTRGTPIHTPRWGCCHYRPTSNRFSRKRRIPQQFEGTRNTAFFWHWLSVRVRCHEVYPQNCVSHCQQIQWEVGNILWLESDSFKKTKGMAHLNIAKCQDRSKAASENLNWSDHFQPSEATSSIFTLLWCNFS